MERFQSGDISGVCGGGCSVGCGADQLEGAGAGRDYGWSVGRNYGQGEGGGGNSWPVGGDNGSWRVLLQDSSSSRVCHVTELCVAKLLGKGSKKNH